MTALLDAPYLTVETGLPDAVLTAFGADPTRRVRDASGTTLATVRRVRGGTVGRVVGTLLPMLGPVHRWDVSTPDGTALLSLRAGNHEVTVLDPAGQRVGMARNAAPASDGRRLRVELLLEGGRDPVAWFDGMGNQGELDHEIASPYGPLGRIAHDDERRIALTLTADVAPPLRTLVVAAFCGLVDRSWWRPARIATG